ncbi:MAG TPA: polysaccharide biosynthesis/export family protein [Terriglobia bacterium]|nr:polysaccharide biosynthesis/export family protein [Terriglobia bacterium]
MLVGARGLTAQQAMDSITPAPGHEQSDAAPAAPGDYVISPDDLLDIAVFDVPEMSREYRVSPGGSIELPLVQSPIAAAGLTLDQLTAAIRRRLQADGLVSAPQVTVEVKESRIHSVAVTGAVKKPQIYPVFGATTLLDVIAQAEGLADDAGGVAVVTRGSAALRATGGATDSDKIRAAATEVVDLKRLMESNDPRLNLALYPGDRVAVERAGVVYVVGAVNRPGGFVLTSEHDPMTVLKAVALAEDLKPTAKGNKAMILQPKSSGSGEDEAPVRLQDILAGRAPDQPLHANDILFVPDSNTQRALRRAAEAAVQAATGVIIWRLP